MKNLMVIMALLTACGDGQDSGWEIIEGTQPTPMEPGRETPVDMPPEPRITLPIPPEVPQEPVEIDGAENAVCETPRHLASGERIRQSLEGLEPNLNYCLGGRMRQRYYEFVVPPNHRGRIDSDMVIYRHGRCPDFAPLIGSDCGSDYVNQTDQPVTYLVAATEYDGRVGEDFTIGYDAVPIDPSASCEQRVRLSVGDSYTWDVRGGYDTYNPCQIIEGHNAFYFHVEFPPDVDRLKVTVSPLDPVSGIQPSIQVVEDMIAQYYPQCGRSDFTLENGECIVRDDAYFRSTSRAEVLVDRPEGFTTDPSPSYLVIVNTGGWYVPSGDARMEIQVEAAN